MKKNYVILSFTALFLLTVTPALCKPAVDGIIPNTVTSLDVELAQVIPGNIEAVPITQYWSTDTIAPGFNGRFIKLPMTENSSGYWETDVIWGTDLPDQLKMIFSSGTINDRNDKNYWFIDPEYKNYRVEMIDPNMCTPRITTSGSNLDITAKGSSSATDWKLNITGLLDTPITLTSTASDNTQDNWDLSFTLPTLQAGLYDLILYATSGGKIRSDFEAHSLQILNSSSVPSEYIIAIFGDQEIDKTGGRGSFNLSNILSEISIVNPLFTVNLGSVSSNGDEATFRLYSDYIQEFCTVPQYMATGHRERFEGSEGDWPNWGMGIGAFERVIGPRHRDWWIGDHFYTSIYPGDHRPDSSEVDFLETSLTSSTSASMKTMFLHDPIKTATDAPSYIPVSLYEQCIRQDPERQDILDLLTDNDVDYYVHSSIGIDGSATFEDIMHISVSGATNGFKLIKVSSDAFESWGETTLPLGNLVITYSDGGTAVENDGSHSTLVGKLTNDHSEPFTNAKITFKMPEGDYTCTGGTIESNHTVNGYTYVSVLVDVAANSFVEATLLPQGGFVSRVKISSTEQTPVINSKDKTFSVKADDERTGWTPLNPSVGDTVKIWYLPVEAETTTETTTTGGSTTPLSIVGVVMGLTLLISLRRRRKKSN